MKHDKMRINLSILTLDFYLLKKGGEEKNVWVLMTSLCDLKCVGLHGVHESLELRGSLWRPCVT